MKYLKVAGHAGLVRDITTGAILNTNKSEYEEYIARQREAEEREAEISQHTEDINNIKNELQDIKSLLLQILKKD
jgi:phage terminase large subunit-like protein